MAARPKASTGLGLETSKPLPAPRQGGALKRKRYDNDDKANAIHFYDECLATGVGAPLVYAAKHCGIPIANLSNWANGVRTADKVPWRDVIFKAAADTEEQKWFVHEGYTLMKDALPDEQFNCSVVGWHVMFKWSGVGWCHGWVLKYYANHRHGYNFEVKYEDVDRRDHILTPKSYGHGDQVPTGTWCLLKSISA
ncbi:hypothetical protein CYMTET_49026 [Cymbomonas tetramitiformis]|uniref:Uncharacterized protein n=1 Tax=Cymbomonas tetramitiformis TaxID=36881 RepID=A0AAE0EUJ6_9CHLO|nr:hypothetical protein CYMTET_49026 [Cymbomonas tetramitiformis]